MGKRGFEMKKRAQACMAPEQQTLAQFQSDLEHRQLCMHSLSLNSTENDWTPLLNLALQRAGSDKHPDFEKCLQQTCLFRKQLISSVKERTQHRTLIQYFPFWEFIPRGRKKKPYVLNDGHCKIFLRATLDMWKGSLMG